MKHVFTMCHIPFIFQKVVISSVSERSHGISQSFHSFEMTKEVKNWKFSQGFTLIEIMIVIGMLGVLVTGIITVINPLKQIRSANDAKRISDLGQLQKALELYYQDTQQYPQQSADYKIRYKDQTIDWGQTFGDPAQPYMAKLPKSPGTIKYVYYTPNATNPQSYILYTYLETPEKVEDQCEAASCSPSGISCYASGGQERGCNYGVSSPNISPYQ